MRSPWHAAPAILALALSIGACAGPPARPSTQAERTPTPTSVTRDDPGGDAANPIDAALTRLLEEPAGTKTDKFDTLRVRLPDAANWRRIRFFGHPTRASFRYGDDAYALSVIKYRAAKSDAPMACLQAVLEEATSLAEEYDVELGPIEREVRLHAKGAESIDWAKREAEMKKRREEMKRRLADARKRAAQRRAEARLLAAKRRQAEAAPPAVPPAEEEQAPASETSDAGERAAAATPGDRGPAPSAQGSDAPPPVAAERPRRLRLELLPRRPRRAPAPRKPPHDPSTWRWGATEMPVVRTWGRMRTLTNRDRYLASIVAYKSWPGTCLVQAFAVKVGSDEALAQRVMDRWLLEYAPRMAWVGRLREPPPIQNR